MSWTASVFFELLVSFHNHSSISLHDPCGNFFIAFPCCILNHHTVFCGISFRSCKADAVIVVHIFDGDCGTEFFYIFKTGLCCALRHADNGFLSKLLGCPCNTAAVVAVCCGEKCCLPEFILKLLGGQNFIRKLRYIFTCLLGDVTCHCKRTTQYLEGIKTESVRFIFDIKVFNTKILSHF